MTSLATSTPGAPAASLPRPGLRPISVPVFAAVAVVSFGGPLALAALYAPPAVADLRSGAGLVVPAAAVLFGLPLAVWLSYARRVSGPGGLAAYVEAAVGRRTAQLQAAVWTVSYVLYLLYTSAYVVYDVMPVVSPAVRPYRSWLELALPVVVAGVVLGGRRVTLSTIVFVAGAQLALVGMLDVVAFRHGTTGGAFRVAAQQRPVASAVADVGLLFVCGSLPLFLGAEVARPRRTIRRVLPAAFAITALLVAVAVLPMALDPAYAHAGIPGMALAGSDLGSPAGTAVGAGVALSVVGVMLVEYVALTRLGHAVTGRSPARVARWLAVPLIAAGPVSLVDPERFYSSLLRPSLVALWLSQLLVVAVYPWFAARRHGVRARDISLAVGATAVMLWGLWSSVTAVNGT